MKSANKRIAAAALVAVTTCFYSLTPVTPAYAQTTLNGSASKGASQGKVSKTKKYFNAHPKVKSATVGAGVGAGVGAVTGLVTGRGVLRGTAIGAGTGAGVGLLQSSKTMKQHPVVKDVAQGTLIGGGLGLAASRGRGTARRSLKTAAAGAAVGLGVGLWKNLR